MRSKLSKTEVKLSETVVKTVINPVKRPCITPLTSINQPGTLFTSVFYYPRFSLDGSKTAICTCTQGPVHRLRDTEYSGYGHGTGIGYGDRVGNTEGYTGYLPDTVKRSMIQRSGPRRPCRGRSGWDHAQRARAPRTHPPGPVGLQPPWFWDLSPECRLLANKGENQ